MGQCLSWRMAPPSREGSSCFVSTQGRVALAKPFSVLLGRAEHAGEAKCSIPYFCMLNVHMLSTCNTGSPLLGLAARGQEPARPDMQKCCPSASLAGGRSWGLAGLVQPGLPNGAHILPHRAPEGGEAMASS